MTNETVSQDVAFRLLSHVYRRALLESLAHRGGSLSVPDAAEAVARACTEKPIADVSDAELEEIALSLHHSHVPQLAAQEAVTYDRERRRVTLTERGERILALHDRVAGTDSLEVADSRG